MGSPRTLKRRRQRKNPARLARLTAADSIWCKIITRATLQVLEENLRMCAVVNRSYDGNVSVEGARVGYTLNIKR